MRKVVALLLLGLLVGCDPTDGPNGTSAPRQDARGESGDKNSGDSGATPPSIPVAVATVARGDVQSTYSTTSTLTAVEEAVVIAKTVGVVKSLRVEEGDNVSTGDVLAQLDVEKLELEVARAKATLDALDRAYARAQQLMSASMISADAFDKARSDYESAKANFDLQQHELGEATLRAPIDGVVASRSIKVGHSLNPGTQAFEIKRLNPMEAILNVPERELSRLAVGQLSQVQVDALPNAQFAARIARIAPTVDPQSGTFRVTLDVNNADGRLKPGMFARVNIVVDTHHDAVLVRRDAILLQDQQPTVFVLVDPKSPTVVRRQVTLGFSNGEEVEVSAGLEEGEQVVITGQDGLRDGASVRIVTL